MARAYSGRVRFDCLEWKFTQDSEFVTEICNKLVVLGRDSFAAGRFGAMKLGNHFGQRHDVLDLFAGAFFGNHAVCQLVHAIVDADHKRLAALWAHSIMGFGFFWREFDAAQSVTVVMVFAFFGEKFDGADEPLVVWF